MDLMHHTCLREYTAGMKMVSPPVAKGAVSDRHTPVEVVRPRPRALLKVQFTGLTQNSQVDPAV